MSHTLRENRNILPCGVSLNFSSTKQLPPHHGVTAVAVRVAGYLKDVRTPVIVIRLCDQADMLVTVLI